MACGVLSRCVKAETVTGKMSVAAAAHPHPAVHPAAGSTMLLMPGADMAPGARDRDRADVVQAQAQAQLTVIYGGRVLVFDDVPADRAAELAHVTARQDGPGAGGVPDFRVARKASLQRFMEMRRDRLNARAPYATATSRLKMSSVASKKGKREADAGCWLGQGMPGCRTVH